MGKIAIGLVGCGRIAKNHISALQNLSDDFKIVAVCDIAPERRSAAAETTGARPYALLRDVLAESKCDMVSLCTPSGLHPLQSIEAARKGVHVLSEKPIGCHWPAAVEAVRTCDALGVSLFVVKQNRLNPTIQALKHAIEAGRFGRIYMISANVFWTRPQDYYDQAKWRGTWEFDGGAIMNQASHYVDLLTYLGGPLDSVHAVTATLARKIEAEDCGVMALRWRSGALGSLNVSMLTYPKNLEGSITIMGEKGTVRIGGVAVNRIDRWEFQDSHPSDEAVTAASYETATVYGNGHLTYYQEVAKAIRGEPNQAVAGREGLVSLQTIVGAYRSAREGRAIHFPLEY
jgi:UDP-N-acetyl-2-amino-2-deoxyglucuronate dehydrogenase